MTSLNHFDLCIGEALEKIEYGCKELIGYNEDENFPTKEMLKHLGAALYDLWSARDILYREKPYLKRDFKQEIDEDPQRYEELNKIHTTAYNLEENAKFNEAKEVYLKLLNKSQFGFFTLLAQAGLYRCSK